MSASQFSSDGRDFQIDYADKAVEKSGTVAELRGKDSVVLAVEKVVTSPLHEDDTVTRIVTVDKNIGLALAGLLADGRSIAHIARQEVANYRQEFATKLSLRQLCERIASHVHSYTLYSACIRPFDIPVIPSVRDEVQGSQLSKIDPNGSYYGHFGCVVGKAKQQAKTEKFKFQEMSTEELVQSDGKM